jgi:hypothetical protein
VPQIETLQKFLEVIGDPAVPNTCSPLQTWAHQSAMNSADPIGDLANWLGAVCKGETFIPARPDPALRPAPAAAHRHSLRSPRSFHDWMGMPAKVFDYAWRKITHPEIGTDGVPIGHQLDEIEDADTNRRVERWASILGETPAA